MKISKKQRVVIAGLALLAWTSLVATGSYSLFKDQVTLTDNVITTGTSDLRISNSQNPNSTIFEESRPGFSAELVPGQSVSKFFLVKNASDAAVSFDLSATVTVISGSMAMLPTIQIEIMPVDELGNDLVGHQPLYGSLTSLSNGEIPMGVVLPRGETQRFRLSTSMSTSVESQTDTISYHLMINGTQSI